MKPLERRMVQKGILCLTLVIQTSHCFALTEIKGAGASFPAPLYNSWIKQFSKNNANVEFTYRSVGSGRGVQLLLNEAVDFGASDIPMTDSNLKKSAYKIIHVPSVVGAIAIIYNHPDIPDSLKIDAQTLTEIFQSKIKFWNHPKLKELNPKVSLPNDPITPIVREDHSGTSKILRQYLRGFGFGKTNWRATFVRATGSKGVSYKISQTKGSIGYINLSFAKSDLHKMMSLKNAYGEFISPSTRSVSLAASKVRGSRVRVSLLNQNIEGAYPLASFSFLLVPLKKDASYKFLKKFITWSLSYGQRLAPQLHYAPLPKRLAKSLIDRL